MAPGLRTRVAQRTLALFLVAALVPMLFAGVVVERSVSSKLTDEAESRLHDAAKNFGLAVFERLELAADQLQLRTSSGPRSLAQPSSPIFVAATLVTPLGDSQALVGDGVDRETLRSALPLLGQNGSEAVLIEPVADAFDTVLLAIRTPAGAAVALLRPDYLWAEPETYPASMGFCILFPSGRAHCPGSGHVFGPGRLQETWSLFLRARFGSEDWSIVASEPEDVALASLRALHHSWPVVFGCAFLIGVLISLVQIRRRHAPLEQLVEATRRIERGDLGGRAAVAGDDEYATIGRALDRAAAALRKQLTLRDLVASINRSIIESHPLDETMGPLLPVIAELLDADGAVAMLLQEDGRSLRVIAAHRPGGRDPQGWIVPDARDLLEHAAAEGHARRGDGDALLGPAWDDGMVAATLWPIRDGDRIVGLLGTLHASAPDGRVGAEVAVQLAGQLSVAVADARHKQDLLRQAYYDALTGLPNRLLLMERLGYECERARQDGRLLAVMFIDLDRFKVVNDLLGHEAGDRLLRTVAARLQEVLPRSATIARLGGDEFAVILPDGSRPTELSAIAGRVHAELARPADVGGQSCASSASIGIAVFPGDGTDADGLLRNADTAMYRAKARARGSMLFYEDAMNRDLQRRAYLERELRAALAAGAIELAYQPKVDLATGELAGAEALARWSHPTDGPISPAEFVPVAEECGLIRELGWNVLDRACAQLVEWRASGLEPRPVAVNVSPQQFADGAFATKVLERLAAAALPPSLLELEVTETILGDRYGDVVPQLARLRAAGIRVSMDDFGTGYSSLAALRQLPIDVLKIDRSFVQDMCESPDGLAIVEAIIVMGRTIGKRLVAEGVESPAQLELLERLGCHEAQGYLLSRPVPPRDLEQWLRPRGDESLRPRAVAVR